MKQRYSSLDVKVIASELSDALVNLRVSNIYDLSTKIFLFKCAKPGNKQQLLVDSGFRAHLTAFSRTAASTPSAFVTKLRKYLKSRRITKIVQIGTDRVIEITFSDGRYHLFLEFFAAGNIILTDSELNILALLRQVNENDPSVDVRLGSRYVLDAKQNYAGIQPVTQERIRSTLENQVEKFKAAQEIGGKKAKRNKNADDLKRGLSIGFSEFPPHLIEHATTIVGLDAGIKPQDVLSQPDLMDKVEKAMNEAGKVFRSLETDGSPKKGFIVAKIKPQKTAAASAEQDAQNAQEDINDDQEDLLYEDFHPFLPIQFQDKPGVKVLEFDGFNRAVDQFFSSIESQRLSSRLTEREEAAKKKLETAKQEHSRRLEGLQKVQELHIRKAQAIEANTHRVEEACAAVNGLIAQGMDWVDIGKLIENEQKRNNIVAQMIRLPLKLHENTVTLLLDEPGVVEDDSDDDTDLTDDDVSDEEEETAVKPESGDKRLSIDVDLALSPWSNAREYYDQKKTAANKETKTVAASEKALKSMEKKTMVDLKKSLKSETQTLRATRKQFWFEKFLYFVSSDGYLVLGGKDAQQNEYLYRRHLKRGDIFVHADLHGASCVIIKNNPQTPDAPVPPSTLSQAGSLSVCSSAAWDSKAVMAAYWVNSDQVSKTAPTGEYLTTGGFVIRGEKNFLPPSQLLLGFGVYWLISEGSRANHGKNRIIRTDSMMTGEAEMLAEDARGLNMDDDDNLDGQGRVPDVEEVNQATEQGVQEEDNAEYDGSSDNDSQSEEEDNDKEERTNPLQLENENQEEVAEMDLPEQSETGAVVSGSQDQESGDDEDESDESDDDTSGLNGPQIGHMKPLRPGQKSEPKASQPKRGANTKAAKRRAAKYALQDEEDKALAAQLLGTTKAEQRKVAEAEAKAAREAKAEAERARKREQHNKAADAEKARQERRELNKASEGAIIEDEDDETSAEQAAQERLEHLNIDLLVPTPEPGDELIAAIPVVAPWTALSRNKYKAKLQPGNVKKGKAMKELVGIWSNLGTKGPKVVDEKNQDKERVWAREIELIKSWKVEEIVSVLPVKGVRIVLGGGQAAISGSGRTKAKGGSARGGKGGKRR